MPPMQTVALGYHDQESPRHWSVCRALRREGYDIIECHTEARGLMGKYRDLWRKYREVSGVRCPTSAKATAGGQVSGVLVTFPGHYLMPLAWSLTRFPRRKLLFDAFVSLYDTNVCDRGRVPRWHPRAWLWYLMDFLSCHLADEVILDTEEHKKYFVRAFRLNPRKIRVIYLDARPDLFFPKPITHRFGPSRRRALDAEASSRPSGNLQPPTSFNVLFYGTYIPLHGIEHIIDAAHTLQDVAPTIHFTMVGCGQTAMAMHKRALQYGLRNMTFRDPVPYRDLPDLIRAADLCLGIFGGTPKAQRVIPHKVYDAVACDIPIITIDSPAVRERYADHPHVILCAAGDPSDLADKIVTLMQKSRHPLPRTYAQAL